MLLTPFWLWIAAIAAASTWAIHTFVGQIYIVRPLLASALGKVPKFTLLYCWHLVTLMLAGLAGGFVWAAMDPGAWRVGMLAIGLTVLACLWSVGLVLAVSRHRPWLMPQWALFGLTAIAGLLALSGPK